MKSTQAWIGNKWIDITFILLPPFFSLLIIILFPSVFSDDATMPDYWWVALVVLIDVAHVYSTLYRTYLDPVTFSRQKNLLLVIPFLSFVSGVLLYTYSPGSFWRILAYLAVFHFVRQQYGFMRIYARKDNDPVVCRRIDSLTIYTATLYPLLYWHLAGDRKFNWFVAGDFFHFTGAQQVLPYMTALYIVILILYCCKEAIRIIQTRTINIPRNVVIVGTIASWYIGIVHFNGDMAFTLLNVVSHGIPYMALIWLYGKKNSTTDARSGKLIKAVFSKYGILLFLGIIFLLAYLEEGLWDIALWKEHGALFGIFNVGDKPVQPILLSVIVPLLALPQVTHYVIDGFIWRIRKDQLKWNSDEH